MTQPIAYLRASDLDRLAKPHVAGCAAALEKTPRDGFVAIYATPPAPAEPFDVDALAQEIRRVDGNHSLGAGALAEALMPFLRAAPAEPLNQILDDLDAEYSSYGLQAVDDEGSKAPVIDLESAKSIVERHLSAPPSQQPAQGQDAVLHAEWMACESRRPWIVNSLRHRAEEMRAAEKRCRNAYRKDFMGKPAAYVADAFAEAAAAFESRLAAMTAAQDAAQGGGQ